MTTSTLLPVDLADRIPKNQKNENLRLARREMLSQTPRTDEELAQWLWWVVGIWLPRHSVCPGHVSPFEYFADRFFGRELNTILWSSRYWGKSHMSGLECWIKARQRPVWEANICSGSLAQATMINNATDIFWRATDDIAGRDVLTREPMVTITNFLNGSKYQITTASTKSQRGPHPNSLFCDEVDEMDVDVFNAAMDQTMSKNGHEASTALLSTMHKVGGLMGNWVDNAELRGYKLYVSCILEALECCSDFECDKCNLDEYCQRRLKPIIDQSYEEQRRLEIIKKGEKPHMGHNKVKDIQQKVRQGLETDVSSGTVKVIDVPAELFSQRPSRTGLVYKEFRENFHVVAAQDIHIDSRWKKGRTLDFGYTSPYVELEFAITPRDQIIFFNEYVQAGLTMPQIVEHLKARRLQINFIHTFADPAGATEIATLKAAGIPCTAIGGEIVERLDLVRHLLRTNIDGEPSIIISSNCPILRREMTTYRYPDNRITEKPVDKDDHCVEAMGRGVKAWREGRLQALGTLIDKAKLGSDTNRRDSETDRVFREIKKEQSRVQRGRSGRNVRRSQDYL